MEKIPLRNSLLPAGVFAACVLFLSCFTQKEKPANTSKKIMENNGAYQDYAEFVNDSGQLIAPDSALCLIFGQTYVLKTNEKLFSLNRLLKEEDNTPSYLSHILNHFKNNFSRENSLVQDIALLLVTSKYREIISSISPGHDAATSFAEAGIPFLSTQIHGKTIFLADIDYLVSQLKGCISGRQMQILEILKNESLIYSSDHGPNEMEALVSYYSSVSTVLLQCESLSKKHKDLYCWLFVNQWQLRFFQKLVFGDDDFPVSKYVDGNEKIDDAVFDLLSQVANQNSGSKLSSLLLPLIALLEDHSGYFNEAFESARYQALSDPVFQDCISRPE